MSIPNFEGNEKKYVDDALEQGWVSTGGAYIKKLEQELATFLKGDNVAACQSGTSALHLSLVDACIQAGDVILVPTVTFIAAINPVKYQGAIPVFIDCDDSLCMDPEKLKRFCRDECEYSGSQLKYKNHPVKAIIIVHIFGNMADMETIMEIAEMYELKVIEDATEALGTCYISGKYAGKYAGMIGDYGAFSFNGNKIITTGGGGAVTSRDTKAVDHIRYLSTQAKDDSHYYIHHEIGYNYRMTNLQAAVGVAQMEKLQEFIDRKNKNYERYKELFTDFEFAKLKTFRKNTLSNKWFYSLEIDRSRIFVPMRRIITDLWERGIETRALWGLINQQKPYKNEPTYEIEKAPFYAERILNIPSSTQITVDDIEFVSENIKQVLRKLANG